MVGDGANDILAIREADVGLSFVGCDGSFASPFSFQEDQDTTINKSK